MNTFNLPDLGEGLPEAEIVTWHVNEGDSIQVDQPLLSVETAKAVVEVPSPFSGVVAKLYAAEGDIVETGKPLVDFAAEGETPAPVPEPTTQETAAGPDPDSGTVVGSMPTSDEVLVETAVIGGGRRKKTGRVKAAPAVRALAKRLGVDLTQVPATGKNGLVTANDVKSHAAAAQDYASPARERLAPSAPVPVFRPAQVGEQPLRGPKRAMAQSMSAARDQVAACTIFDDADIHDWIRKGDVTTRVLRAVVAGCRAEPGLNAHYDGETMTRTVFDRVDIAMAVDTPDGLIVPVVRHAERKNASELRADVNQLKEATRNRTVAPEDMRDFTITLSNFGMMAGRYATPVVVPPTVAILGTGGMRHDVVAVMGGIEVHRRIPLSLTFDHRCITGGEACRFLAAVIDDLAQPD